MVVPWHGWCQLVCWAPVQAKKVRARLLYCRYARLLHCVYTHQKFNPNDLAAGGASRAHSSRWATTMRPTPAWKVAWTSLVPHPGRRSSVGSCASGSSEEHRVKRYESKAERAAERSQPAGAQQPGTASQQCRFQLLIPRSGRTCRHCSVSTFQGFRVLI